MFRSRARIGVATATHVAVFGMLTVAAGCASSAASDARTDSSEKKLSVPEAEAGLSRMFSDSSGNATFSCGVGSGRHEFICQGRYVPINPSEPVIAHRIGVSVSHYEEGKPVFAIVVLRDK